jgi:hypothetical protein
MNSTGNVGLGITPNSSYRLYVNDDSYLNSSVGIGVAPSSSYKLYVSGYTYLNSSLGIRVAPNADYKLGVTGPVIVNCGAHSAGLVFKWNSSGYASLYPFANNTCSIGNSSSAFTTMYAYSFTTVSDARQKENLKDIESPLQTILNLKGLKYDIKKEYSANTDSIKDITLKEKIDKQRFGHIGFLAQDVQKVLPEAVAYDDVTDVYTMNYSSIVPVLVEAIKEQQLIIEDMAKELKSVIDKNSQKGATIGATNKQNLLYQNAPNPFSASTQIEYFIIDNTQNAMINIYNMNGTQLKSIQLHQTGSGFITISGSEFTAGMYMYALIADGQAIDTKQMILTD